MMNPILQKRGISLREVEQFPQGHTANEWKVKNPDTIPQSLLLGLISLNLMLLSGHNNYLLWKTRKERHRGRK